MTLPYKSPGWKTAPISPTCEHLDALAHGINKVPIFCGRPTSYAYPAHGSGWMPLCKACARPHHPHIFRIDDLIKAGETFEGALTGRIILARCECGNILSEEELRAGFTDVASGKSICRECWDKARAERRGREKH